MSITLYRIQQFLKGLTAFRYNDYELVDKYLNTREKELFLKLPSHEKKHAVDTANTIQGFSIKDNRVILIKAALLHDIGKISDRVGIIKKSILVLMDRFLPVVSRNLSNKSSMFYIYYNHPEIGARLLKEIGTEEGVILLIRYHHSEKNVDIKGMDLLKKADSLN